MQIWGVMQTDIGDGAGMGGSNEAQMYCTYTACMAIT